MDTREFHELARQLAKRLGTLRSEDWTVTTEQGTSAVLSHGIAKLAVSIRDGRLRTAGMGPYGNPLPRWTITASTDRTPLVLVKDINRRILGAGYVDDLLYATTKKNAADQRFAAQLAELDQAAGLFGLDREAEHKQGDPKDRLYLGKFVAGQGYVESSSRGPGQLSINLSGIPVQVALDMLKVLAQHVAAETVCCWRYGPGHHPQFTMPGCLGQKAERGEAASADRVARLVASIALPGSAQAALDEARNSQYKVGVVMDGIGADARALAVVSWDQDGCGEYTVELTRRQSSADAQLSYDESEALFDRWRNQPDGKNWSDWLGDRTERIHPAWR